MMPLRTWQLECIEQAVASFDNTNHFLCHATPGAGKTLMVATLAKTLIHQGKIDLVFCYSPSLAVALATTDTFTQILEKRFDGRIGSVGASFTYQSMNSMSQEHWRLLEEYRVLVVLDEIHHCSGFIGAGGPTGNSWGLEILHNIQGKARYTIALSGTPWRTDDAPIALSRYSEGSAQVQCDYQYGLSAAVSDRVCRAPRVVLTDNREIRLASSDVGAQYFESIEDSLNHGTITYQDFLHKNEVLDHILIEATIKLRAIRSITSDAAGLVVASSIRHAFQIAERLALIDETFTVVTHQTPGAQNIIIDFKQSSVHWIISVGMISEGTDIPRLHVCCHLSRIRTELHFRQVLGRILRKRPNEPEHVGAWLYVLAEPTLEDFARRIGEELPAEKVVSFALANKCIKDEKIIPDKAGQSNSIDLDWASGHSNSIDSNGHEIGGTLIPNSGFSISDHYWQEVLSLFGDTRQKPVKESVTGGC